MRVTFGDAIIIIIIIIITALILIIIINVACIDRNVGKTVRETLNENGTTNCCFGLINYAYDMLQANRKTYANE